MRLWRPSMLICRQGQQREVHWIAEVGLPASRHDIADAHCLITRVFSCVDNSGAISTPMAGMLPLSIFSPLAAPSGRVPSRHFIAGQQSKAPQLSVFEPPMGPHCLSQCDDLFPVIVSVSVTAKSLYGFMSYDLIGLDAVVLQHRGGGLQRSGPPGARRCPAERCGLPLQHHHRRSAEGALTTHPPPHGSDCSNTDCGQPEALEISQLSGGLVSNNSTAHTCCHHWRCEHVCLRSNQIRHDVDINAVGSCSS